METLMNMFKLYPEEYGTEEAKILIFQDSNRSEKLVKKFLDEYWCIGRNKLRKNENIGDKEKKVNYFILMVI